MRETHRFQTLVTYFTSPQEFQIEFMVACMQFINIVVHSVEVRQPLVIYQCFADISLEAKLFEKL